MSTVIAPLQRTSIGKHFHALGLRGMSAVIDPFMNVDHAWMSAPTFPPHLHSGFSAVSYVFLDSETGIDNRDSLGTHNLIRPGGLHWVTAGSGVMHQENPAEAERTVHSLQIFVALARGSEAVAPSTMSLEPADVPVIRLPRVTLRVPLGNFRDVHSPLQPPTQVTMLDIALEDDGELLLPIEPGISAFLMPIDGTTTIDGQSYHPDDLQLPVFRAENGFRSITLHARSGKAHVVYFAGPPLRT